MGTGETVRLEGVALRYGGAGPVPGAPVLRDLSFALPSGAFRWLLGPSGSGKTSLLCLLALAMRPTAGRLYVFGRRIDTAHRRDLPALRRRIGMVFQDGRLLPQLSVFDNLALPRLLAGHPKARLRADVTEMLRWAGLERQAGAGLHTLSAGERQHLAFARAVIARPALLLADEPTANLDAAQSARLLRLLTEMSRLGTAVMVATQDPTLLARHPVPALHLQDGV